VDELHTFRGAKADHLTFLLRRLREIPEQHPLMIGASATLGDDDTRIAAFGAHVMGMPDVVVIRASFEPLKLNPPDHSREENFPEKIAAYDVDDLKSSLLVRRIADRLSAGPASVAGLAAREAKLQQTDRGTAARLILEALRRLGAASRAGQCRA
jgi:hypothetical protein